MTQISRSFAKWTVVYVALFILFFAFGLSMLLLLPLTFGWALETDPALHFGFWSQVRLAAILGTALAVVGLLALLARGIEPRSARVKSRLR